MAYLKNALKDGPANLVIKGPSGFGSNYAKAIKCLHERYDQPRLIQGAHVCVILEAPLAWQW